MTASYLSNTWGIRLKTAQKAIQATTQRGLHSRLYPTVERRFAKGVHPQRYWHLPHHVYHDTLKLSVKSHKQNKCAEMYVTDFRWCRAYLMKQESAVHETLDDLFHQYGILEVLVSNNAKALTQGNFTEMTKQAKCTMEITDPYSPWQSMAEVEI